MKSFKGLGELNKATGDFIKQLGNSILCAADSTLSTDLVHARLHFCATMDAQGLKPLQFLLLSREIYVAST